MKTSSNLISTELPTGILDLSESELAFLVNEEDLSRIQYGFYHKDLLKFLSMQISRTPEQLVYHVQRIFYCFREDLNDQLYAAMLDLMLVLKGKGTAIFQRLMHATKSKLSTQQVEHLRKFRSKKNVSEKDLQINSYAILTQGLVGQLSVLEVNNKTEQSSYQPLQLARDYIEYSQLQEAREILEQAIHQQPDDQELHVELLNLLACSQDKEHFNKMLHLMEETESPLLPLWEDYVNKFAVNNHE